MSNNLCKCIALLPTHGAQSESEHMEESVGDAGETKEEPIKRHHR
jgi:hypothetical protein